GGKYERGEKYLDDVLASFSYDDIALYEKNASILTESVLSEVNWHKYGLCVEDGANDYPSAPSTAWHLDGLLKIDYKVLVRRYVECDAGTPGAVQYNGKHYIQYGNVTFVTYDAEDIANHRTLVAEDLA